MFTTTWRSGFDNTYRNYLQVIDSLFMVSFWGYNSSQFLILQA